MPHHSTKDNLSAHSPDIASLSLRVAALEANVEDLKTALAITTQNIAFATNAAEQSFDSVDRHHRELADDFDDYRSVAEHGRSKTEARIAQLERDQKH